MAEERIIQNSDSFDEEIQAAKDLMKSFSMVLKSYALYPEGHSALQKTLTGFKVKLDAFFQTHGDLRLTIDKEELLCSGEVIHNDTADGESIAFSLFRDGIQWLEFQEGMGEEEVSSFFKIMNQYRILAEETDGDIVTALYDSDFDHLAYEATNIFWEGEPLIDLSSPGISPEAPSEEGGDSSQGEDGEGRSAEPQVKEVLPQSIADSQRDSAVWEITPVEREQLGEKVRHAEEGDTAGDVFDVLLVIMEAQNSKEDFATILEYTKEELQDTLVQGEFYLAGLLLRKLLKLSKAGGDKEKWLPALIEQFFQDIADQEFLAPVMKTIPDLNGLDNDLLRIVRRTLLLLPPKAIISIGPALLTVQSNTLQKILMEVIGIFASSDIQPLKQLLDQAEEKLAEKLVFIIGHLKGEEPTKILNEMIHHTAASVRVEALNALIRRDPKNVNKLFSLIDDPSTSIRNSLLHCLGQQRSLLSENRILHYMEQKKFVKEEDSHVLPCYRALGGCGSIKSMPFLKNILLGQKLNTYFGFGKLVHRQGAAEALYALNNDEARAILEEASQSGNTVIQQAVQLALAGKRHG